MSIDHVLDLFNVVAQSPPEFTHSQFSGVPFNALLIDLINTSFGKALFSLPEINEHLKNIFNDYGRMLKSKKSLSVLTGNANGWLSEKALQEVNYNDFICDPSDPEGHYGFGSWNDWFTRKLKKGARPVDHEHDPLVITNAAQHYPLTTVKLPYLNVQKTDKFWLKENRYSLYDMF